jgi:hypothetical protein
MPVIGRIRDEVRTWTIDDIGIGFVALVAWAILLAPFVVLPVLLLIGALR